MIGIFIGGDLHGEEQELNCNLAKYVYVPKPWLPATEPIASRGVIQRMVYEAVEVIGDKFVYLEYSHTEG